MDTERTDESLVAAARDGDRAALEELLSRHQSRIYRYGMKMCGDPEDAQDVLQETLIALSKNIGGFRGDAALSTWLYTVARSFCLKKRRKSRYAPKYMQSIESEGHEVAQLSSDAPTPDDALSGREVEEALERAISDLDPEQREVLVLRDMEGLTAPEVSSVLGISVPAVKSRLHRARLAVRDQVKSLIGDESQQPAAAGESCPDVLTLYSKHLEDEISADLCAKMEEHVAKCPRCRGACDSLKRTLSLCRQRGEAKLPAGVQRSVRTALKEFLDAG